MNNNTIVSRDDCESIPIEHILNQLGRIDIERDTLLNSLLSFYYKNDRHRYSLISKYILENKIVDTEKISVILMNVDILIKYCTSNESLINKRIEDSRFDTTNYNFKEFIKQLKKLNDHLELEVSRANAFDKRQEFLLDRKTKEFAESVDRTKESLVKLEDRLNTGFISILGIFSAIIIAFFGGISAVTNIFSGLTNPQISTWKIIFFGCLAGIIVFNIIFMFLYFLSKFVDKNLCCRRSKNINVQTSNMFKIAFSDYPFVTYFNLIFIVIILFSSWKIGLWV